MVGRIRAELSYTLWGHVRTEPSGTFPASPSSGPTGRNHLTYYLQHLHLLSSIARGVFLSCCLFAAIIFLPFHFVYLLTSTSLVHSCTCSICLCPLIANQQIISTVSKERNKLNSSAKSSKAPVPHPRARVHPSINHKHNQARPGQTRHLHTVLVSHYGYLREERGETDDAFAPLHADLSLATSRWTVVPGF